MDNTTWPTNKTVHTIINMFLISDNLQFYFALLFSLIQLCTTPNEFIRNICSDNSNISSLVKFWSNFHSKDLEVQSKQTIT